jgi:hypothetical protein
MAVPAGALNYVRPTATVFELEALEGLPCGCVAAAYRARPWDVAVVSLDWETRPSSTMMRTERNRLRDHAGTLRDPVVPS